MKSSWKNVAEPILFFVALLVLWEILVEVIKVPAFILPPPGDLVTAFIRKMPILGNHALITFIEAFGGFVLSLVLGVGFAIAVVYSRHLQNTIYPLIVILYAMPKSAFAPLMVIWVGYGLFSKIAIAFLVAFFPIVVNTVVGLKEVEPELLVIDSFKAIGDVRADAGLLRTFVYDLAVQTAGWGATSLLVGEYSHDDIGRYPEFAIADGIISVRLAAW